MTLELRKKLIRKIIQKAIDLANQDPVIKQLAKEAQGETMLFLIEDLAKEGGTYGFIVNNDGLTFVENPDLNKPYNLIATCNEDTFIHMLRGHDPEDLFWAGYIDVAGTGWFKRVCLLRRVLKLGEQRGLKGKVVSV